MLLVQISGKRNIVLYISAQASDSRKFTDRTAVLKDQTVVGKNFKALVSFFCIKITVSEKRHWKNEKNAITLLQHRFL